MSPSSHQHLTSRKTKQTYITLRQPSPHRPIPIPIPTIRSPIKEPPQIRAYKLRIRRARVRRDGGEILLELAADVEGDGDGAVVCYVHVAADGGDDVGLGDEREGEGYEGEESRAVEHSGNSEDVLRWGGFEVPELEAP